MSQANDLEEHMHRFRRMAATVFPHHALNDSEVLQLMQRLESLSRLEPETISVQMPEGMILDVP